MVKLVDEAEKALVYGTQRAAGDPSRHEKETTSFFNIYKKTMTARKSPKKKSVSKKTTARKTDRKNATGKKAGKKNSTPPKKSKKKRTGYNSKYVVITDLPDCYNRTYLRALPKDPEWLFAYWEISKEHIDTLRNKMGDEQFEAAKPTIRVAGQLHAFAAGGNTISFRSLFGF